MLGGINNSLFLQAIGGFLALPIFFILLRWAFPSNEDPLVKQRRKALKKSLRALRRK